MIRNIKGISVQINGDENRQSIVFIHGFPFDNRMWNAQVEFLSNNFYCVTYDIRGFGNSFVGDGQYTMETYVDDLLMVIKELELQKPVICGLSMGGYITLRALERDQSLFAAAVLMDTKPQADDDEAKLKRAAGINQINTEGLDKFAEAFIPNTFAEESKTELKDIYNKTLEIAKSHNPIGVKGALLAMLSRTSTEEFLPNLKIPVLSIVGNLDKLTPPPVMREMTEKIPNGDFAIAPRSGHMTPIENPSFVNDMIAGFMRRLN